MKKLTYLLLCLVLGIGLATAQTRKVTGTVISAEDSEPIIGASVIVKGTTTGTVTDFDGAFSLRLPLPQSSIHPGLYLVRRFPVGAEKGPARMPVDRMDKFQCHDGNLVLWRPKVGKNLRKDL